MATLTVYVMEFLRALAYWIERGLTVLRTYNKGETSI